jgi:hypothetical protein
MTKSQLSRQYLLAAEGIHQATTELYEKLHGQQGSPVLEREQVEKMLQKFQMCVREELNGIRESLKEYNKQ